MEFSDRLINLLVTIENREESLRANILFSFNGFFDRSLLWSSLFLLFNTYRGKKVKTKVKHGIWLVSPAILSSV